MDRDEADEEGRTTDELLEELQEAAELHKIILMRQAELIERLREELKGVSR